MKLGGFEVDLHFTSADDVGASSRRLRAERRARMGRREKYCI
jgi:hypothetical protein